MHCINANGTPRLRNIATASAISVRLDMPVLNRIGAPVAAIARHRSADANSPEPIFHAGMPMERSRSIAAIENAELKNTSPHSRACAARPCHCLGRELHSLPIIETGRVLLREAHSERLIQGRLRSGDVSLELDRVGAGIGDHIDEGMSQPKRAIMRLRNLSDDKSWVARPNAAAGDTQTGHVPNPDLTNVFISGRKSWRLRGLGLHTTPAARPVQVVSFSRLVRAARRGPLRPSNAKKGEPLSD